MWRRPQASSPSQSDYNGSMRNSSELSELLHKDVFQSVFDQLHFSLIMQIKANQAVIVNCQTHSKTY